MVEKRETVEFVEKYTDQWDQQSNYGENLSSLKEWEQNAYLVDSMNMEVHSAGFAGYLVSDYYPGEKRLRGALEAVGAENVIGIFEKVRKKFPFHHIPKSLSIREKILEDFEIVNLDDLDEQFYEYPDSLSEMVKDYIVAHEK